jgi:hypothetical protein
MKKISAISIILFLIPVALSAQKEPLNSNVYDD